MSAAAAITTGHVTASELASLRLPGWPSTRQGWNLRRAAEQWPVAARRGPRGAELIEVAGLPDDVRAMLIARRAAALRPLTDPADMPPRGRGRPKGSTWFDAHPDAADAVLSWVAAHKHSAPTIHEMLVQLFGAAPDIRTVRRHIAGLERAQPQLLLRERNPDKAKGKYQIALGRADGGVTAAHQVWELDTTKADVMLAGGRKMILGVIDRWSRRVRFLVAPSESGQSVRRLLIDTIVAWGVTPETVVTDNGSGYINASIVSALDLLGIQHVRCLPGTPEHKPFVERLFGTFTRQRAVLLDGFTGHNVAHATELRSRAKKRTGRAEILGTMTPDDLQAALHAWTDGTYHQTVHGTLGVTPLVKWMSSPLPARAAPDRDRLRRALSAVVGPRTIGKRGLEWKGGTYWCAELAACVGKTVMVRRDEDELGELLVFDEDGLFIGCAINHERSGLSEQQYAVAARNHQREHQRDAAARLRAVQKAFPIEVARDRLLRAEAERAGKLVTLPLATTPHSTATLDSLVPTVVAPLFREDEMARAEARITARHRAPVDRSEDAIRARMAAADAAIAADAAGDPVAPDTLQAARLYASSGEYRTQRQLDAWATPSTETAR